VGLSRYFDTDYHFQLDRDTLSPKRHEIIAGGGNDLFRANVRYFYTSPVEGTGFDESRQQVEADTVYNLNSTWKWRTSGLMDFGDQPGLRNATTGFEYADECFTFSIMGSRNVADVASGDNDTRILLRIGFKSIGEFSGPQIPVGQRQPVTK
jgi:LPS-assembly protein